MYSQLSILLNEFVGPMPTKQAEQLDLWPFRDIPQQKKYE